MVTLFFWLMSGKEGIVATEFALSIGMQGRARAEILGCAGVVRESVKDMASDVEEGLPGVTGVGMGVFGKALEMWFASFRAFNRDLMVYGEGLGAVDGIAAEVETIVSEAMVRRIAAQLGGT